MEDINSHLKIGKAQLLWFDSFWQFNEHNKKMISENPFFYFYLKSTIEDVFDSKVELIEYFNVIEENKVAIVLIVKDNRYTKIKYTGLFYATDVSSEMIEIIECKLGVESFYNMGLYGTKNIIDLLCKRTSVEYSEQKHRKYYECSSVINPFLQTIGSYSVADSNRKKELFNLSEIFHKDFFGIEEKEKKIKSTIEDGLTTQHMYQWVIDDKLVGMAQAIMEHGFPVIGHVVTHPDYRGIGIASSLTHKITEHFLDRGYSKCWLMTDAYNVASNKSFQSVGYNLVGEYVVKHPIALL